MAEEENIDQRVFDLYDDYCHGGINRRQFFSRAAAITVGGVSAFSNAVNDAFAHMGLVHTQMPHDHWRVWKVANDLGLNG